MNNTIKQARIHLSRIEISTDGTTNSKVIAYAEQVEINLMLGRAWLGEALKGLGEPYPYESDEKRSTIGDIKPAADVSENDKIEVNVIEIDKNSELRLDLTNLIDQFQNGENIGRKSVDVPIATAVQHFKNARIFLGFILGNLRDVNEVKKHIDLLNAKDKLNKKEKEQFEELSKKLLKLGSIIDVQ